MINGSSTGFAPIHVRIKNDESNIISEVFFIIIIFFVFLLLNAMGVVYIIATEQIRANTPPILLGMERKMAYANRKYHSGWMCGGDFRGSAWLKFSGSPNMFGFIKINIRIINIIINIELMSFIENLGWNEILSLFIVVADGFDEPDLWRVNKWIRTKNVMMNGKIKWNEKNRFNVGFDTEKLPHNHITIFFPTNGTTERRLVITVVPQNDICPHGSTYPTNAVIISKIKIDDPDNHVSLILYEFIFNPLKMCM